MDASVVSCGDAPPVLAPAEHAFDEISCLVEFGIVVDRLVAVGAAGDAGFDSAAGKRSETSRRRSLCERSGSRRPAAARPAPRQSSTRPLVGRRTKALPCGASSRARPAVDTARKSLGRSVRCAAALAAVSAASEERLVSVSSTRCRVRSCGRQEHRETSRLS